MKKILLFVTLLAMLATLAAGCAQPQAEPTSAPTEPSQVTATEVPKPTEPPAATGPKVLRVNMGTWPDLLDPQKASFVNEIAIMQMVYEGLVRLNQKGEVIPGAAEKWETSPDGKTMTFNLRSGLKRADGTPLTAGDFEYAYKRLVDPRVAGEYSGLIDDVVGAVEARELDPTTASEADIQKALDNVGVKATDDNTLVVNFKNPVGYWSYIAYTWVGWPSDRKQVEAAPEDWWNKAEGHNGNGPWKIDKYEDQNLITFVPNPNYWGPKPKLDRIEFRFITETAISFEAYQKGELDVVLLAPEDLATVEADPELKKEFFRGPAAWVNYMGMHNLKPPFDNKEVRMAFAQAFDRETYVRDILKGQAKTYLSWIPPGVPGYDESAVQLGYDPEAAVKRLIDAGYAHKDSTPERPKIDCEKLGQLKLTYAGTARNHARFQFIAGNFAKVFGCPVTLDPVDPTVFTSLVKDVKTAPQIFLLGWVQDYPHPQNWLFIQRCGDLFAGRIAYCNEEFDTVYKQAAEEVDPDKAVELYKQAQKIFLEGYPGAMLYYFENWYLVKPYVKGLIENYSTSDAGWPGQFGPVAEYDIDLSAVGPGYPKE